ncbi:MAG TPA: AraC family transcriptional regulator ligand-binding domain-containing protein, partial [Nevskia sp.]|nr:AraC family transcriptional regulator ligand-binding domain-containing protein [Nevskia sp.]
MHNWDFQRGVASMQLQAQLGVEHGLPLEACLEGTGVTPAQLADPAAVVGAHQELSLVRNLVRRLGHIGGLGLEAGTRYHFTVYGILGFAIISSRDLRSAMDVALRYLNLTYAYNHISGEESGGEMRLVFEDGAIPEDVRRFLLERDAAAAFTLQREMFSQALVPRALRLRGPRPSYAERYTRLFGVEPQFGAARNEVALDAVLLDAALPQANEPSRRMAEEQCRLLLTARKARSGLAEQVRDQILRQPGQMPQMGAVADKLLLTPRTLRRRLLEEGTSYKALTDEVRETLAEEMLSAAKLSVE